jgi:hypothetical protein
MSMCTRSPASAVEKINSIDTDQLNQSNSNAKSDSRTTAQMNLLISYV